MTTLYSFEIFDTLITRKVAVPVGIFALMQEIVNSGEEYLDINSSLKCNFIKYRSAAEYRQRQLNNSMNKSKEVTLNQIYEDIKNNFFLTDLQTEKLKELEIRLELDNVIPIDENINRINELKAQGKRVILISDMYLPEEIILKMLEKCGINGLKLYLSSTVGLMKSSSKLFRYIKKQENIDFKDWVHIGENRFTDYEIPLGLKINSEIYDYVKLKKYEQNLRDNNIENPAVQLLIGCAKNIRLKNKNSGEKYHFGSSFGGPILYPYVSWLLEQAQKRGIKRLYFIARDGYVLKHIADYLIEINNIEIETFYLYGSRKAWRLPALDVQSDMLYKQFIECGMWNFKQLDKILGLDKNILKLFLPTQFHGYSKGLNRKKFKQLKEFLLSDRTILEKIADTYKDKRKAAVSYLKQSIDCTDDNFAFVDLDGSGLTQNCLASLMKDFYCGPVKSFYYCSTPAFFEAINVERYYYYSIKQENLGSVLELLTKAPHGQTLGYEEKDSKWIPVLESVNEEFTQKWGLNEYVLGILCFVKNIEEYKKQFSYINLDSQILPEEYIGFLNTGLDKDTAKLLGSIVHSYMGDENFEYAPEINFFEAVEYFFTGKLRSENVFYSGVRSHRLIRKILEYKQGHLDLCKELFDIFIHKRRQQAYIKFLGFRISFRHFLWKDVI